MAGGGRLGGGEPPGLLRPHLPHRADSSGSAGTWRPDSGPVLSYAGVFKRLYCSPASLGGGHGHQKADGGTIPGDIQMAFKSERQRPE